MSGQSLSPEKLADLRIGAQHGEYCHHLAGEELLELLNLVEAQRGEIARLRAQVERLGDAYAGVCRAAGMLE